MLIRRISAMILWQDIKSQVELDIVAGVYHQVNKPNKLPSISEMAQKYNCGKRKIKYYSLA